MCRARAHHWRQVGELISIISGAIWLMIFSVKKVEVKRAIPRAKCEIPQKHKHNITMSPSGGSMSAPPHHGKANTRLRDPKKQLQKLHLGDSVQPAYPVDLLGRVRSHGPGHVPLSHQHHLNASFHNAMALGMKMNMGDASSYPTDEYITTGQLVFCFSLCVKILFKSSIFVHR